MSGEAIYFVVCREAHVIFTVPSSFVQAWRSNGAHLQDSPTATPSPTSPGPAAGADVGGGIGADGSTGESGLRGSASPPSGPSAPQRKRAAHTSHGPLSSAAG